MLPKSLSLEKTKAPFIAGQRAKWQAVKAKHAAAIKAKKINFNKNLGGMLDKRKAPYVAVKAWRPGDSLLIARSHLTTIKSNSKDIEKAVAAYRKLIAGMGDPAEAELEAALDKITNDVVNVDKAFIATKSGTK